MNLEGKGSGIGGFVTLASFVLVAAVLYFARVVFIPLALAALLCFLLAPLVTRLMRIGLNKAVAIISAVAMAFSIIAVIGWLVTSQLISLIDQMPRYQANIHQKLEKLKKPQAPGPISRAAQMVQELRHELETPSAQAITNQTAAATKAGGKEPVPVEVKAPKPTTFQVIRKMFGPVLGPLGTAGIVVVLLIMMLFELDNLRERFLLLISGGRINVATQAVDDAAKRVSRYLFMQLVVNATYGIPVGIALYFIGVPNALLWGLLCILLRFIPYLGPWIGAFFPIALSVAVDPGWTKLFLTGGMFVVVELLSNNFVEPWLYGSSTGTSQLALVSAAVFWTWLWGPVGLFLSTPLTVCLMVLGRYVPGLKVLSIILSSGPVLEPSARFYQRMLAMDQEEVFGLAEKYVEEHSSAAFYDEILVPALILCEEDRTSGGLAEVRQKFIFDTSKEIIEDLQEKEIAQNSAGEPAPAGYDSVMCIPVKDDADELVALMLKHLLLKEGIWTTVLAATTLPNELGDSIKRHTPDCIVLSAVPPNALLPARHLCKRVKQRFPGAQVLAGVWSPKAQTTELSQRFGSRSPDIIVTNLAEAVQQIKTLSQGHRSETEITTSAEPPDVRLGLLEELDLASIETEDLPDAVIREVAQLFDVPISLVSLIDSDEEFWRAHLPLPADTATGRETMRETSLCSDVTGKNETLIIADANKDPRFAANTALNGRGIKFFAGTPLRDRNGQAVGSLCVIDTKPRTSGENDKKLLERVAEKMMIEVERRQMQPA